MTPDVKVLPFIDAEKVATVDDVFALAGTFMQVHFNEHGNLPPLWWCVGSGRVFVIMTPWESEKDKNQVAYGLRRFFKTLNVERYAFMSEMWVARTDANTPEEEATKMPEDRADRTEGVMLNAFDRETGAERAVFYEIKRSALMAKPQLVESEAYKGYTGTSGRMFNLFKDEPVFN